MAKKTTPYSITESGNEILDDTIYVRVPPNTDTFKITLNEINEKIFRVVLQQKIEKLNERYR